MHELSITQQVLDIVLNKAKESDAHRVSQVNLVVGDMSSITDDCLQFYFDFLSKDTIVEGAKLSFQRIAVKVKCQNCGNIFSPQNALWECSQCHQLGVEVIAGNEFYIDSIEVD